MVTIADLGILRSVEVDHDGGVRVEITPTYSGCPAMDTIRDDLMTAFAEAGYADVRVDFVLAPAWTTDWMTAEGHRKLEEFGIAPPTTRAHGGRRAHRCRWPCRCAALSAARRTPGS